MSFFKKAGRAIQKAGHQATQNITAAAATPFQIAGGAAAKSIQGIAPALSAATGVIQQNPGLFSALGDAIGMPGLGGLGGGQQSLAQDGQPAGAFASAAPASNKLWLWIGLGVAAVLALVLILRRRKPA